MSNLPAEIRLSPRGRSGARDDGMAGRRTRPSGQRAASAAIVDTAATALIAADGRGKVTDWNAAAERLFGWRREEILGRRLADTIVPATDRARHAARLDRFVATGKGSLVGGRTEVVAARRDGTEVHVALTISAIPGDGTFEFTAFIRNISERNQAEETLAEAEELFRAAFDYAPIGMTLTSLDGVFLRVNRALSVMLGRPIEELAGMPVSDLTHPEDRAADAAAMRRMARDEEASFRTEKRYLHADGHWVWTSLSASIVCDAHGRGRYFVSQIEDITQRRDAELMRRALASMDSGISLIDVRQPDQPLVYVNAAFERLTGYPAAEVLGRSWKLSEGAETDPETASRLHEAVECGEELRVPLRHHRRDGTAYWSETLMAPVYAEDAAVTHYLSVQKDVTEKTDAAQRAAHMAYHDPLTGLPNRAQLEEHISLALARAERKGTAVAVLFLDLNHFKQVNDRHGHEVGDRLLEDVARRWRSTARRGDVLARYGGDEFVLLMTDIPRDSARESAAASAARYVDALKLPFDTLDAPGQLIVIGVSAGIALYPEDATTPALLLLAADAQMYAAKRAARAPERTT